MKYLIILLSLIVSFSVLAQKTNNELTLTSDSDTSFYEYHREKLNAFELIDLQAVKADFIFRSWNPLSVLTIKKADNEVVAEILYRVEEVVEDESQPKTFRKIYTLPSEKAEQLYDLIINDGISNIPSDKFIKDWEQGLDGITYTFETKSNENYTMKRYWTPSSQEGLDEAEQIMNFKEKISIVGELNRYGELFENENPFSAYTYYGVSYSIVKIKSKEEIKKKK